MPEESHDPGLTMLAGDLALLVPSAGAFSRDRLLFRAGQLSKRGTIRLWRAGTLAAFLVGIGIFATHRVQPPAAERLVYLPIQVPAKAPERLAQAPPAPVVSPGLERREAAEDDPLSVYRLEQVVMRDGIGSLPAPAVPTSSGPILSMVDWHRDNFSTLMRP
jgi:hypothetical protein